MNKPTVYIASPYSNGDPEKNAHFQCKIFDQLLGDGKVLPIAPLWSHFQHMMFPRDYQEWIDYDQEMLRLYDYCLHPEKGTLPFLSKLAVGEEKGSVPFIPASQMEQRPEQYENVREAFWEKVLRRIC